MVLGHLRWCDPVVRSEIVVWCDAVMLTGVMGRSGEVLWHYGGAE